MKVYIATRYKGDENKTEIEALCRAVQDAKLVAFNFTRDVERYGKVFDDPQELWERARDEVLACDAFLIDVSDYPTGGRLVEMGIAYAKRMPIIVIKKRGIHHKNVFDGTATALIEYTDYKDLTHQLKQFDKERHFDVNDQMSMLGMFIVMGFFIGWGASQLYLPLGPVAAIIYWLLLRWVIPSIRVYDRIVIYIPLATIWIIGYVLLQPLYTPLALAWLIAFWIVALFILRKIKFSL